MKQLITLLILVSVQFLRAQGPNVCLSPALNSPFSTGINTYPKAVALGDFNGDGKKDMAVANQMGNNVSVFLGTGTGNFAAPASFGVGGVPYFLVIADFNNDGKSDIATANNSSSSDVSVLLGTGTGSFSAAVSFTTGSNPQGIASADFNGDGNKDLVITGSSSVTVMMGLGTGSFGAVSNYAAGSMPQSVTTGDFNNDGKMDIASANRMSFDVSILLGNGSGSFAAAANYTVGAMFPCSIVSADFNSDGQADLATANFDFNNTKNVTVLLNSSGSFTNATVYSVGANGSETCIYAGDVNGDGNTDIAAVNSTELGIIRGNGSGTFGSAYTLTVSTSLNGVVIGDLNGDNRADIAMAAGNNDNVEVYLNRTAVVIASGPTAFCSGGSVVLRATKGGNSYLWSPGGSTADSLVVNTSGSYSVSITSGACVSAGNSISVTVNPLPAVSISSVPAICQGQTVTLSASGASTYTWNTSATGSSISVSPASSLTYSVTGKNANGCMNSAVRTVTVNPKPVLNLSSTAVTCNGSCNGAITPSVSSGTGPFTYSPSALSGLCAGAYTVVVTDSKNCSDVKSTVITQPSKIVVNINSTPSVICAGNSSSLSAFASGGTGAITYSWSSGASGAGISVSPSVTTSYTVTATDANNCIQSGVKTVSVNSLPVLNISSGSGAICTGQSATLSVSGASTYSWSTGNNGSSIVVSPTVNTTYSVSGTDANGCMQSTVKTVTVNSLPVINVSSSNNFICTGQSATLSVSGASTYSWSTGNNGSAVVVSPTVNTTYSVSGTDANGCINGAAFTESVSTCSGITELGPDRQLNAYPNPNNGHFIINIENETGLIIINQLGEVAMQVQLPAGTTSYEVSGLKTGVYFICGASGRTKYKIIVMD